MEKIAFTLEGEGTAWFYVLEQTMIYEIVEEDTELAAVASVFESMLEDIEIEP